jgi:hypothetical protein
LLEFEELEFTNVIEAVVVLSDRVVALALCGTATRVKLKSLRGSRDWRIALYQGLRANDLLGAHIYRMVLFLKFRNKNYSTTILTLAHRPIF